MLEEMFARVARARLQPGTKLLIGDQRATVVRIDDRDIVHATTDHEWPMPVGGAWEAGEEVLMNINTAYGFAEDAWRAMHQTHDGDAEGYISTPHIDAALAATNASAVGAALGEFQPQVMTRVAPVTELRCCYDCNRVLECTGGNGEPWRCGECGR